MSHAIYVLAGYRCFDINCYISASATHCNSSGTLNINYLIRDIHFLSLAAGIFYRNFNDSIFHRYVVTYIRNS